MRNFLPITLLLAFLLAACQPVQSLPNPSWPTPTRVLDALQPFHTPTPQLSPTGAAPRPSPAFTHTPLPSPTPFLYIVKRGDTMLGIALFYGIELAALKAANPDVDPLIMSVGTQLVIPLVGSEAPSEPTSTPVPLALTEPACFAMRDGSLWCSLVLHNTGEQSVENLSVLLDLVGPDGGLLASQVLFSPLNRLPSGGRLGLAARFAGLAGEQVQPYASLLTAVQVGAESERYLETRHSGEQVQIDPGGRKVQYRGLVEVLAPAQSLWVVVSAFDAQDRLVAQRKLVFAAVCTPEMFSAGCPAVVLDGTLFSAGPEIARVAIQSEARP